MRHLSAFTFIIKRDGSREPFDFEKLQSSIQAALLSAGVEHNPIDVQIAHEVHQFLKANASVSESPTTEQIRDAVQAVLLKRDQTEAARSYILFRYLPKNSFHGFQHTRTSLDRDTSNQTLFPHPTHVRKRDGKVVDFDLNKIALAIHKAGLETGKVSILQAKELAKEVVQRLAHAYAGEVPSVEKIQDMVEIMLMKAGHTETAKAYILYRNKRSELRQARKQVPEHVKHLANQSKKYFRNSLAEFVYYRTYSRWIESEGRRETWIETVDRYVDFMRENLKLSLTDDEYGEVREAILNHEAMPSMRLLQFAGPAARKTNVCAYNCSFIAPSVLQDFGEIMYISMCGTGVGFSVESKNVQKLPQISHQTGEMLADYIVPDTKEGWADALVFGMKSWFAGKDLVFDYSQVRPAGERLKTMGGRSSGPEPLRALIDFTREKILRKQGRRLSNIDVHDIICKIGEIVVAGGVRRSALISLSDLDDQEMRSAKMGQFYLTEPHRSMANNSAVYETKPTNQEFMDEWIALMKSGTGERGIFNRAGLAKTLPKRRLDMLHGYIDNLGTNPCGEIILQSKQFCNLSEVVARPDDTLEVLLRKVRIATLLGTYQATLTNFEYLSEEWKNNCEKERLLGVSITGQWDCPLVRRGEVLDRLREEAIRVNRLYAQRFGINASTCITCVKPSGNLSQTVDASSGMHPRHAKYYIRRVRISANDSLFKMLRDQKVPYHPEVGQDKESATTVVLDFPVKAPESSVVKNDLTALEQLEYWRLVKEHFTEHNPSVTISVGDDEWIEVANWIYSKWELIGGLSFLPRSNHTYRLAPYEEISRDQYEEMTARMPDIDFSQILMYEKEDETEVAKELACVSGACEIDIDPSALEVVQNEEDDDLDDISVESSESFKEDLELSIKEPSEAISEEHVSRVEAGESQGSDLNQELDVFTRELRERVRKALDEDNREV